VPTQKRGSRSGNYQHLSKGLLKYTLISPPASSARAPRHRPRLHPKTGLQAGWGATARRPLPAPTPARRWTVSPTRSGECSCRCVLDGAPHPDGGASPFAPTLVESAAGGGVSSGRQLLGGDSQGGDEGGSGDGTRVPVQKTRESNGYEYSFHRGSTKDTPTPPVSSSCSCVGTQAPPPLASALTKPTGRVGGDGERGPSPHLHPPAGGRSHLRAVVSAKEGRQHRRPPPRRWASSSAPTLSQSATGGGSSPGGSSTSQAGGEAGRKQGRHRGARATTSRVGKART
jgi:hypothetical protein